MSVVICISKLFIGTTVGFGILGAFTAIIAGGIAINKENPLLSLGVVSTIILIVGWINSVFILQENFFGITSILYMIMIIVSLLCGHFSEKGVTPSAILLVFGLVTFIAKLFSGTTVGIGLLGCAIAIVVGSIGLKRDNPTFYLAISAGIITLFGFLYALTTDPFVMGMLSFAIGGVIFIIAASYSKKDLKVASIVLLIIGVSEIIIKAMYTLHGGSSGLWINYICPFLALIAGVIGLAYLTNSNKNERKIFYSFLFFFNY